MPPAAAAAELLLWPPTRATRRTSSTTRALETSTIMTRETLPDKDLPAASLDGEAVRRKARQELIPRTLQMELEQQEEKDDAHGYHPTY